MNIIEIEGLTKDYALDKTTLLNIIGCIDLPTSGIVKVSGQDLNA